MPSLMLSSAHNIDPPLLLPLLTSLLQAIAEYTFEEASETPFILLPFIFEPGREALFKLTLLSDDRDDDGVPDFDFDDVKPEDDWRRPPNLTQSPIPFWLTSACPCSAPFSPAPTLTLPPLYPLILAPLPTFKLTLPSTLPSPLSSPNPINPLPPSLLQQLNVSFPHRHSPILPPPLHSLLLPSPPSPQLLLPFHVHPPLSSP